MYVYKTLDDKEACVVLFLDLSKAFHLVNHNILLQILHAYGIRGTTHQWFVSYLKNRKQLVKINYLIMIINEIQHNWSEERIIQYRVSHGSIVRPFLFLIYINDTDTNISDKTSVKITLFADDITNYWQKHK